MNNKEKFKIFFFPSVRRTLAAAADAAAEGLFVNLFINFVFLFINLNFIHYIFNIDKNCFNYLLKNDSFYELMANCEAEAAAAVEAAFTEVLKSPQVTQTLLLLLIIV